MDIVQRLIALGIRENGPADILLNSKRQFQLIKDFEIDLRADKNSRYRCMIAPNPGGEVFQSPVVGHSSGSLISGMSLQVGIFTLLHFKQLVPLLPVFKDSQTNRLSIGLYRISNQLFDLERLVKLYKVDRVFEDFQKMLPDHRSTQSEFLEEYDRKKTMQRKIAKQMDGETTVSSLPGILMEEVVDEELYNMVSSTLELQKSQYEDSLSLDPWGHSSEKK